MESSYKKVNYSYRYSKNLINNCPNFQEIEKIQNVKLKMILKENFL